MQRVGNRKRGAREPPGNGTGCPAVGHEHGKMLSVKPGHGVDVGTASRESCPRGHRRRARWCGGPACPTGTRSSGCPYVLLAWIYLRVHDCEDDDLAAEMGG